MRKPGHSSLRRGVQFQKGYGEMTSEDVAFTFGRLIDPSVVISGKVLYDNIAEVAATDAGTVEFRLQRPDPLFCGSSAFTMSASIVSKKAFQERGDKFALDPVGTGPYPGRSCRSDRHRLSVRVQGSLRRRRGDAETRGSATSSIRQRARWRSCRGRWTSSRARARPAGCSRSSGRKPDTIIDGTKPGSVNTLHLNLTRKPLDDLRVRQAIRYAIDNAALAHAYGEMGGRMWGINPPQFPGSVSDTNLPPELRYDYDPDTREEAAGRCRARGRRHHSLLHQPARGLQRHHADGAGAVAQGRYQPGHADRRSYRHAQ